MMTPHNIGNPQDWTVLANLGVEGSSSSPTWFLPVLNGQRTIKFDVFSNQPIFLMVELPPDYAFIDPMTWAQLPDPVTGEKNAPTRPRMRFPLAQGKGHMQISLDVAVSCKIYFFPDEGTEFNQNLVWVRPEARSQQVVAVAEESYTTIEPRGARDPNLDRIMMTAAINEALREAQFQQELANIYDQFGQVIEPPQTAPEAPASSGEGSGEGQL